MPSTTFVFFRQIRKKQNGRPGLWLAKTFSTSPLKPLNRIQWNLIGSKISTPSTKFVFFRWIGKTKWLPWPMIGWDIFDFSCETTEGNSKNLDRKQVLNVLYQVWVFRADPKKKYGRPGLWLAETYFDFSSETAERNSAKLDRKQDLNVLYQVCVFRAEKWIKIATLANPSKKVAHWLRCTLWGPLGLWFMNLFRWS